MKNIGLTGIIPYTYFEMTQGPVASTDLRVEPIIRDNVDFEKWIHGKKYDNLIFQQTFWKEMALMFMVLVRKVLEKIIFTIYRMIMIPLSVSDKKYLVVP